MTFDLSWSRRDEETGKRIKITFKLVREDGAWIVHRARFESRTDYTPEARDWEDLIDNLQRKAARGNIRQSDIGIVKKLHNDWLADQRPK